MSWGNVLLVILPSIFEEANPKGFFFVGAVLLIIKVGYGHPFQGKQPFSLFRKNGRFGMVTHNTTSSICFEEGLTDMADMCLHCFGNLCSL